MSSESVGLGRVPPNALDEEAITLSAILLIPAALDEVRGILEPGHMYSAANAAILRAAYDLADAGKPTDLVSVKTRLSDTGKLQQVGGSSYLVTVADAAPSVAHFEAHAQTIRDKWRLRKLIEVCQRSAGEGYTNPSDVQAFIDQTEQEVFQVSQCEQRNEVVDARDVVLECIRIAQAAAEAGTQVTGLSLGLSELDRKTTGAHGGELYVIAGRPGHGKTALGTCIALAVSRQRAAGLRATPDENGDATEYLPGKGSLYFSCEMPAQQIGQRMLATEARIDLTRLRAGQLRQEDWSKLVEAASRIGKMPIRIDDTAGITLSELRSKARRVQAQWKRDGIELGVVVVDYLGLMTGAGLNREQEVSNLSRGLKQLAKELNVPVLVLAQLNRDCEKRPDKRPQLSDLRDSGSVEQDADVVLMVYRDEKYHQETPDKGIAELIIAKQRMGPVGTIKVRFTEECARFDTLTDGGWDELDEFEPEPEGTYGP